MASKRKWHYLTILVLFFGLITIILSNKKNQSTYQQSKSVEQVASYKKTSPIILDKNQKKDLESLTSENKVIPLLSKDFSAVNPSPTMVGTTVDGGVDINQDGKVIFNLNLKHLFDYFLIDISLENLQVSEDRMLQTLKLQGINSAVLQQVQANLNIYLQYKNKLNSLQTNVIDETDLNGLTKILHQRSQIRKKIFGEEIAQMLFAKQEKEEQYDLAVLQLQKIPIDSTEYQTKQQEIALQRLSLDLHKKNVMDRLTSVNIEVEKLKQQGATEYEIKALRSETFGEEVSQRLQKLDDERLQWQYRVTDFYQQYDAENKNSNAEQKQANLSALLEQKFNENEQKRVRALLTIKQSK